MKAAGLEAKTIHRLLEFSQPKVFRLPETGKTLWMRDFIIIDETSMVDILLMNHLLNAIENGSHVLFVGDMDQLPSVGPGNVLRDLIDSGVLPVVCLDTVCARRKTALLSLTPIASTTVKCRCLPKKPVIFSCSPNRMRKKLLIGWKMWFVTASRKNLV